MGDGGYVVEYLNAFNNIMTQLISIRVKMDEEDHSMALLCTLFDSWDNLVMAIESIVKKLVLDEIMVALLLDEVRRFKASESSSQTLVFHGRSKEENKKR